MMNLRMSIMKLKTQQWTPLVINVSRKSIFLSRHLFEIKLLIKQDKKSEKS